MLSRFPVPAQNAEQGPGARCWLRDRILSWVWQAAGSGIPGRILRGFCGKRGQNSAEITFEVDCAGELRDRHRGGVCEREPRRK